MKAPGKLLVPHVAWPDLWRIAALSVAGALVAGCYGILHDQLTFTLSAEYFTQLKFAQFEWAACGLPPRGFVAEIGFLATWWVGFAATWFFARLASPRLEPGALGWSCVAMWALLCGASLSGGVLGFLFGPRFYLESPDWLATLQAMKLSHPQSFAQVAGIHLGGYLGALGGWLWAMFRLVRKPVRSPAKPS